MVRRMTIDQWLIFLVVWIAASLPLGPNALNCIALSAGAGLRRSLYAVGGILIASACHMTATLFGVAALLAANAALFHAVKLTGAAYLIWMGIALWRKSARIELDKPSEHATSFEIVFRAFLISMSNPKAVFAYLAVFSQFVDPDGDLVGRLSVLVPTSFAVTVLVYGGYCLLGAGIAGYIRTSRRQRGFNRVIGALYVAAGTGLALTEGRPPRS
jgi:threonine/homoserine/homoserine lactone efflux protein